MDFIKSQIVNLHKCVFQSPTPGFEKLANTINGRLSRNSKHQHADVFNKSGHKTNLIFKNSSPPNISKKFNTKG